MDDLESVRSHFENAGRPYLLPWSWLAWGLILPAAALATPNVQADGGPIGVLILWSLAVILGGVVEVGQFLRRRGTASSLATWVFRAQANLSLVAVFVSIGLLWQGTGWLIPAVWLLLLGHSLFTVGGLAFRAFRSAGLIYQLGGLLAIWPHQLEMKIFAVTTLVANLLVGVAIWRGRSASH